MKNVVITISREFGCGGREIGREIAAELGLKFYDKDLIDEAAKKAGVHAEVFQENDEKSTRFFREFSYGTSTGFYSDKAIRAQAEVIREVAQKGSCVIFGRCSDYLLKEYPNCFNLFLYAPMGERIKHIAQEYQLDEKGAEKMIRKIDRQRHNYYKFVTGKNRGDRDYKHLMLDVSYYGVEGSVKVICDAIRQKFGE